MTHFNISLLVTILFCNLYIIFILSYNNKNTTKKDKPTENVTYYQNYANHKKSQKQLKIRPLVNDDKAWVRKQFLKEQDDVG